MAESFRFGTVEVRPSERQVLVDGAPAAIGARAFDVLVALIERRDRLVTKAELLDVVWPGVIVEESNVQVQVSGLRRLLGDGTIATIPGRGYRFTATLEGARPLTRPSQHASSLTESVDAIGRDAELATVERLLADHRLVSIIGPGGIGKTCLARLCASGALSRHADGHAWVDLAPLGSADAVPAAIARATGLHLGDGAAGALLGYALGGRDMLLVLDNCEHLLTAVGPLVTAMLAGGKALRILVTSQASLHVVGEHVLRLGPLPVPPVAAPVAMVESYPAVQLLQRRAQAADARFSIDEHSAPVAAQLCRQLDGIPLAIEMAAARIPALGLRSLAERLGERLHLLRSGNAAAPSRQQTLEATVGWSYSLLGAEEQAVLRRLSVFRGSFSLRSAQRVAAGDGMDDWAVLDALAMLVDKSLVQADARDPPRYRLLETTRLYARTALEREGEVEEGLRRHGEAMVQAASESSRGYWSGATPDLSGYLDDYDDLNAALEHACGTGAITVAATVSRMLNMLDFERNVHSNVRRRKEMVLPLLPGSSGMDRAQLMNTLGLFRTIVLAQVDRVTVSRDRVAAWRAVNNEQQIYIALARLGSDLAVGRDFEGSQRAFAEARAMARPGWPPIVRWFHHYAATNEAFFRGDASDALRWAGEMLAVCEQAAWKSRAAEARVYFAHATLFAGDARGALEIASRAESELRALNHPTNLGDALSIQAAAHIAEARLDQAGDLLLAAASISRPAEVAQLMFDFSAAVLAERGECAPAARLLGFADRVYATNQDRRFGAAEGAEREARRTIEAALGPEEHRRLRDEGSRMGVEEAFNLVKARLAEKKKGLRTQPRTP